MSTGWPSSDSMLTSIVTAVGVFGRVALGTGRAALDEDAAAG